MRHALTLVAAVVCLAFASAIMWIGRHGLTHFDIIAAGISLAVGFALALGTDFGTALAVLKPYIPIPKLPGGGAS